MYSVTKEPIPQLQRQDISLNNNSKVSAQTSAGPKQLGGTIRPGNRTDQSASAVKLRMYIQSDEHICTLPHVCVYVLYTCVHSDMKTTEPTFISQS